MAEKVDYTHLSDEALIDTLVDWGRTSIVSDFAHALVGPVEGENTKDSMEEVKAELLRRLSERERLVNEVAGIQEQLGRILGKTALAICRSENI